LQKRGAENVNLRRVSDKTIVLSILAFILIYGVDCQFLLAQKPRSTPRKPQSGAQKTAPTQESPFTLGQILIALETRNPAMTPAEQEKFILQRVRERGIVFIIRPSIEDELKKALAKAGYGEELLNLLKALSEGNKAKQVAAHFESAKNFKEKGQIDAALAEYDQAAGLDPQNPVVYIFRANLHQEKKRNDLALADYNKALELSPQRPGFYLLRGQLYEKMGEDDKAIADYARAVELDKNEPSAYYSRAKLLGKKKLYNQAIEDYTRVISLRPNDEQAKKELQSVSEEKKEADAAAAKASQPMTGSQNTAGSSNTTGNASPQKQSLPETQELKIIYAPTPTYTEKAFKNKVSGTVRLRITFLASGEIGDVVPVTQLPDGLTEQAISAAKKIKFEPARQKGVPQTVVKDLNYNFRP
jgi:TonB family protein